MSAAKEISKRAYSSRFFSTFVQYTEPLIDGAYRVTPALDVPKHIVRPPYVGRRDQEFADLNKLPIIRHDKESIDCLRASAKLASGTLSAGMEAARLGGTTNDIDKAVHDYIIKHDAYPTPIDYMHFPKSVCTSVNEVLWHGIPDDRPLKEGDYCKLNIFIFLLGNIDVTCYLNGFHGDNSAMVEIGEVHPDIKKLIRITREAMFKAIEICKPGENYGKIGEVVTNYVSKHGYSVWKYFTGHGIGKDLHLAPYIYHSPGMTNAIMESGNVFTIEPIIMLSDAHDLIS